MTMAAGVAAVVVLGALFLMVTFPPRSARRWRHYTRPLRRRLRPRHYRAW